MKLFLIGKYPEKVDIEEYTKCWLAELDAQEREYTYKKLYFREQPLRTLLRIPYYFVLLLIQRPHILHVQYFADVVGPTFPFLILAKWFVPRMKVVYTVHEKPDFMLNSLPSVVRPMYLLFERITVRLADHIIVHTQDASQSIQNHYGVIEERISVVQFPWYDAVETVKSHAELQTEYTGGEQFTVTLFGRIVPKKGHDITIPIIAQLREQGIDVGLVIAGPESERHAEYAASLRAAAAEHGIADHVHFHGYLTDEQIAEVMHVSDLILFPYRSVTQSGVFYTALAYNTPVVAFDLPGFAEFMETYDVGELVPAENTNAFAEAIAALLNNKQRRTIIQNTLTTLQEQCSWKQTIQTYDDIYKTI